MSYPDLIAHVRGTSRYIDDMREPDGLLHAAAVASPVPHAKLLAIDATEALLVPGVHAVFTAGDIPGDNQIGGIIADEALFAIDTVHFIGQPVAMVVAETPHQARAAAQELIRSAEA